MARTQTQPPSVTPEPGATGDERSMKMESNEHDAPTTESSAMNRRDFVRLGAVLGIGAAPLAGVALRSAGAATPWRVARRKTTTMTLGTAVAATATYPGYPFKLFKQEVEKRTGGAINVNIVCCSALGPEDQLLKQMTAGSVQGAAVTTGLVVPTIPEFAIPGMPFIFKTNHQGMRVLNSGPVGRMLNKALLDKTGVRSFGYFEIGGNYFLNASRPINSLKDLRGMKVRVPNDPVQVAAWTALGTNPTILNFGEVYTALQTHTIDGLEATINGLWAAKFYEQAKYLNYMGNYFRGAVFGIADNWLKGQPSSVQKAIAAAAAIAVQKEIPKIEHENSALIPYYKKQGVTVTKPDVSAARKLMAPVYTQFASVVTPQVLKQIAKTPTGK
jgi:tripartite ATP-independent transporter DctP family solute receptor